MNARTRMPVNSGLLGSGLIAVSWSEHDGRCGCDGRQDDIRASVVACGGPAPVLDAAEHDLDPVVAFVAALVVADGFATRPPTGNARAYPHVFQRIPEPVGIVSTVRDHPFGGGQTAQQRGGSGVVTDLAGGQKELQRTSLGVCDGM